MLLQARTAMVPIIITISIIIITAQKKNLRMRKSNPSIIMSLRAPACQPLNIIVIASVARQSKMV